MRCNTATAGSVPSVAPGASIMLVSPVLRLNWAMKLVSSSCSMVGIVGVGLGVGVASAVAGAITVLLVKGCAV